MSMADPGGEMRFGSIAYETGMAKKDVSVLSLTVEQVRLLDQPDVTGFPP
jgi:hypothetical protein